MEYIVYVDSDNRNQAIWPNSNSYTLHLTTPILNISEVELVSAQLPSLASSQFVTLDITELRTPLHLTADALSLGTVTSNAFDGSFATIPIKISGAAEFYNANYRISTKYPAFIDKLDRVTVSWRQPNNGSLVNCGRNMFLLKFKTQLIKESERADSLPPPVDWESGDRQKLYVIAGIALIGLLFILLVKRNTY
jgi:hypothetical protein